MLKTRVGHLRAFERDFPETGQPAHIAQNRVTSLRWPQADPNHFVEELHPIFTDAFAKPFGTSRAHSNATPQPLNLLDRDLLPVDRNAELQADCDDDHHDRRHENPQRRRQPEGEVVGLDGDRVGAHAWNILLADV